MCIYLTICPEFSLLKCIWTLFVLIEKVCSSPGVCVYIELKRWKINFLVVARLWSHSAKHTEDDV